MNNEAQYHKVVQVLYNGSDPKYPSYDLHGTLAAILAAALPKLVGEHGFKHSEIVASPISRNISTWRKGPLAGIRMSLVGVAGSYIVRQVSVRKDGTIDLKAIRDKYEELAAMLKDDVQHQEEVHKARDERYKREDEARARVTKATDAEYDFGAKEDDQGVMVFHVRLQDLTEEQAIAVLKAYPQKKEVD